MKGSSHPEMTILWHQVAVIDDGRRGGYTQ